MAGVVPRLYQLLSNAVEEDGTGGGRHGAVGEGGNVAAVAEAIRTVLHGKPWLWVGDAFVPTDQVKNLPCPCPVKGMTSSCRRAGGEK